MIRFKTLTIRNFMSIGEIPQTVDFDAAGITLVVGENLDMVTDNQTLGRNGSGKTTVSQALSFALYGQSLSNIKRDNLINNINQKGMLVVFEFEKDGKKYKIERGRKPAIFRLMIDNKELENTKDVDESQGESRHTQEFLDDLLGMSHNLYKHLISLNTSVDPFLKLNSKQQREFIEELLGMKMLTEKAEILKEQTKEIKEAIKLEEVRINTVKISNDKIQQSIDDIKLRAIKWDDDKETKVQRLTDKLIELEAVNIDAELTKHQDNQEFQEVLLKKNNTERDKLPLVREKNTLKADIDSLSKDLEKIKKSFCPTCDQAVDIKKTERILKDKESSVKEKQSKVANIDIKIVEIETKISEIDKLLLTLSKSQTYYTTIKEAYSHKTSIEVCMNEMEKLLEQQNPYNEQVSVLSNTGIQEIDFTDVNDLSKVRDHQEFLYKLLTSNESFLRKRIIDQNILFLNARLHHYLEKLGLPHRVIFENDLSVMITNFGHELDFESLSRGEKTRLILSLSWSFRDIFEVLVHPINMILIDELLDTGSDVQMTEASMSIIKKMSLDLGKSCFIISHKTELQSKCSQILKVVKESGFSTITTENEEFVS